MITLWSFIIVTVILIASLFKLRGKLDGLVILGTYLSSNILIELSGIIININLELTHSPEETVSLWTQKIASILTQPILIIWIIALLFSKSKGLYKWIASLILIVSLVAIELVFVAVGFLKFVHWNTLFELFRYLIVVALTVVYVLVLNKLIKKEMMSNDPISTS